MKRQFLLGLFIATPALARPGDGVKEEDLVTKSEIRDSVAAGELLPWTIAATHVRLGMLVKSYGGFDAAKSTPVMSGTLEASLIDRVTLRATASNPGMSEQLAPGVGLMLDVTREEHTGLDLAVGGDYEHLGWQHSPALITRVAAGSTAGALRLQGNAGFGLATSGGERYGDLRLSGLHPVAEGVYAGIDTRARVDLERDSEVSTGELDWDMQAGPVAQLAVGRWSVSATGGVSAWKLRSREEARVGAIGAVGVGAVF
jgi:hypothetical protein